MLSKLMRLDLEDSFHEVEIVTLQLVDEGVRFLELVAYFGEHFLFADAVVVVAVEKGVTAPEDDCTGVMVFESFPAGDLKTAVRLCSWRSRTKFEGDPWCG